VNPKLLEMIRYATDSRQPYSGAEFPAGYHTLRLGSETIKGQRDCAVRVAQLPIDFKGRVVMDFGCNQGGMLTQIAGEIKFGYGLDKNSRMVNLCQKLRQINLHDNLNFFTFDLEGEDLGHIYYFLEHKVDISFFMSMSNWVSNWREVLTFVHSLSPILVLETNGELESQEEQDDYVRRLYKQVRTVSIESGDDRFEKRRRCYVCNRIGGGGTE